MRILVLSLIILIGFGSVWAQGIDPVWLKIYPDLIGNIEMADAVVIDAGGNSYMIANNVDSGISADYVIIKHDPLGNSLWTRTYNGPAGLDDFPWSLALDPSGNLYVSGFSWDNASLWDIATVKYDPSGNLLWAKRYNGPNNNIDVPCDLAIDRDGNAIVTGRSKNGNTADDYLTIKYLPDGDTAWVRWYNGPDDKIDFPHALAVDNNGNVYVTGESNTGGGSYFATIKYDPDGNQLWVDRYADPRSSTNIARAMAIDNAGAIIVSGQVYNSVTKLNIATVKYDPDGHIIWSRLYNGSGNGLDDVREVAADNSGNIYLCGRSEEESYIMNLLTIKYGPDGELLWVDKYPGPDGFGGITTALTLDPSGKVYVVGYCQRDPNLSRYDLVAIKYLPEGYRAGLWADTGIAAVSICPYDVAADADGKIYIAAQRVDGTELSYRLYKLDTYMCGDINGDDLLNLTDITFLIKYLYDGGPSPMALDVVNIDGDLNVNIRDITHLIRYLYLNGPAPICP